MAKAINPGQYDIFEDWLVVTEVVTQPVVTIQPEEKPAVSDKTESENARYRLALRLADVLGNDGKITAKTLNEEANLAFGGTQAEGVYSSKDAYYAMEAAVTALSH